VYRSAPAGLPGAWFFDITNANYHKLLHTTLEKTMKHSWIIFVIGLILLSLSGPAQAVNSYSTVDNLLFSDTFKTAESASTVTSLSGFFDFLYLGYEAGDRNVLLELVGNSQNIIFSNKNTATAPGTPANGYDIGSLFLQDKTTSSPLYAINQSSNFLKILQLTQAVQIAGFSLEKDWYLFGFNDSGSTDSDYDDLVFAAKAAPVPVPAAVWMLGTALVGLVGVRRIKTA
jgi:hypothetical protein